jgi:hypothetical protein
MAREFTDFCIYTIKHSDDLAKHRSGTFPEKRTWVTAQRLLDEARRSKPKKVLPIIFSPAEGTKHLYGWAVLRKIDFTPEGTSYTFEKLKRFKKPQPLQTALKKKSNRKPLHKNFIRPYAICFTPDFLT